MDESSSQSDGLALNPGKLLSGSQPYKLRLDGLALNLGKLLSGSQPYKLRLVGVQFKAIRRHPMVYFLDTCRRMRYG